MSRNPFNLPDLCYVFVEGEDFGREIGIVKRGEQGYYPAPGMTREVADKKNATMKVSHAQREAMAIGSMFGWHVPGANPEGKLAVNAKSIVETHGPSK